jgi:O-antigen ligase
MPRSVTDALVCVFVWWLGSGAATYVFTAYGVKPLYSYIALVVFSAAHLSIRAAIDSGVALTLGRPLRSFFLWLLGYVLYGIGSFVVSTQSAAATQHLVTLVEMVLVAASLVFLMLQARRLDVVATNLGLLALLSTAICAFDFLYPTFTTVPGRAAGMYENPTTAGLMIALCMTAGLDAVPPRLRAPFVVICGAGILSTFTRSAWLLWVLSVVWLGAKTSRSKPARRFVTGAVPVAIGGVLFVGLFGGVIGNWLATTALVNYLDANTLARLGVGALTFAGDSSEERVDVALYALSTAIESNFLGRGIGYTYEWTFPAGPHNMYLLFLAEGGLVGLLLYVALMWLIWKETFGTGRLIALQIVVAGFFSHNLLEQPPVLLIIAFALVHGAVRREGGFARAIDRRLPSASLADPAARAMGESPRRMQGHV